MRQKNSDAKWRLNVRKFERTGGEPNGIKTYHKARVPGTPRKSRMPGGNGYRNNLQ